MFRYELAVPELNAIKVLLNRLLVQYPSSECSEFLEDAAYLAHDLPLGLRRFIRRFRSHEVTGYCVVGGFQVDDQRFGATPIHWNTPLVDSTAKLEEMFFVLVGALLGDSFSFRFHAQTDRIIHNVLPMKGYETSQLAFSSSDELLWHTEDAFHSCRADYLGLMCLRNDEAVPTTIATVGDLELSEDLRKMLFQRRFLLYPDDTHRLSTAEKATPAMTSVLLGNLRNPYICIDPLYMRGVDPEAQQALDELISEISRKTRPVALSPGEVCFIDNFRSVHGRKPFAAKFDGRDRWLKRIYLARDLRKSSHGRNHAQDRMIQTTH